MSRLLQTQDLVTHSVVIGETRCRQSSRSIRYPRRPAPLPRSVECPPRHVLDFLENHRLFGSGLSWGDVQLLAAADFNAVPLWTLDKRLEQAAQTLGLAWTP